MSPERRNQYLSMLGVARYVPRRMDILSSSGGIGSDPMEKINPEASIQPQATDKPASDRYQTEQAAVATEPAKQPVVDQEPALTSDTAVNIRLAFWQPSNELMIFDSLLPGQRPEEKRLDLLSNILQAIEHPTENLDRYELLDWPLARNKIGDYEGAHIMLSTFIKARLQRFHSKWVLLMGECASRYVLPQNNPPYSELLGQQVVLADDARAIIIPGLSEMLGDRSCKAKAWEALKFLSTGL